MKNKGVVIDNGMPTANAFLKYAQKTGAIKGNIPLQEEKASGKKKVTGSGASQTTQEFVKQLSKLGLLKEEKKEAPPVVRQEEVRREPQQVSPAMREEVRRSNGPSISAEDLIQEALNSSPEEAIRKLLGG